jgi:hypothetical protein
MKKRIPLLLAFWALFISNLHSVEYKMLFSPNANPSTVSLAAGDIAEVLYLQPSFDSNPSSTDAARTTSSLSITLPDNSTLNIPQSFDDYDKKGGGETKTAPSGWLKHGTHPVIVGPATLSCSGSPLLVSLRITRASELASASGQSGPQAKYASVIPENLAVDARVRLQQSTDLINWTDVAPGEFAPSANKRFFRVASELVHTATITGATSASPIVITANAHRFTTSDQVQISGVQGNATANGTFTITVTDANSFSLNGADGSSAGAYVSGGTAKKL